MKARRDVYDVITECGQLMISKYESTTWRDGLLRINRKQKTCHFSSLMVLIFIVRKVWVGGFSLWSVVMKVVVNVGPLEGLYCSSMIINDQANLDDLLLACLLLVPSSRVWPGCVMLFVELHTLPPGHCQVPNSRPLLIKCKWLSIMMDTCSPHGVTRNSRVEAEYLLSLRLCFSPVLYAH